MNINNLSKRDVLENAVMHVNVRIQGWIAGKVYTEGKVIYSKLNKDSIPIIGVRVSEKIDTGIYPKHLEFTVANDRLIPTIPVRALCDTNE
jgi:hypothetical protein